MKGPHCKILSILGLVGLLAGVCQAGPEDKPQPKDQKNFIALRDVVGALQVVLDQGQAYLQKQCQGKKQCLSLQSAEFDFQTITTRDITGGLIVSIVTAEGEHIKEVTRETDFIYSVPTASSNAMNLHFLGLNGFIEKVKALFENLGKPATKPEDLTKTLPAAIIAAADTMTDLPSIHAGGATGVDLSKRSFKISISFSVSNSLIAGADPSSLVIVAPELKFTGTKKNVQTVTLTYADQ